MRLASCVPGELIPLPLSGSIPELLHVEKVENRQAHKISRKSNVSDLSRSKALQNRDERRWSFLR